MSSESTATGSSTKAKEKLRPVKGNEGYCHENEGYEGEGDDDDDEEEEEEDDDDEMEEVVEEDPEVKPENILSRRTRGKRIDYTSAEALAKAGLVPESNEEEEDEED